MAILDAFPTGSNYICDPPVTTTDVDYIVLVDDMEGAYNKLIEDGCESQTGDEYAEMSNVFISVKDYGGYPIKNYILTENKQFFNRFVVATKYAKKLNLTDKAERVAFFNSMLHKFVSELKLKEVDTYHANISHSRLPSETRDNH